MDRNYLELLRCLNGARVRYLVIGGYAVIHYAEPRYTKDLDIWIECTPENAKRVLKALHKFGAPIDNLTVTELSSPGLIYVFGIPPLRVDILNSPKGVSFAKAWTNRERVSLQSGKLKANFIGKAELIKLKKAASRPQDLADLEKLS